MISCEVNRIDVRIPVPLEFLRSTRLWDRVTTEIVECSGHLVLNVSTETLEVSFESAGVSYRYYPAQFDLTTQTGHQISHGFEGL